MAEEEQVSLISLGNRDKDTILTRIRICYQLYYQPILIYYQLFGLAWLAIHDMELNELISYLHYSNILTSKRNEFCRFGYFLIIPATSDEYSDCGKILHFAL